MFTILLVLLALAVGLVGGAMLEAFTEDCYTAPETRRFRDYLYDATLGMVDDVIAIIAFRMWRKR